MHNVKRLTAEKRAELRAANEEKAARYRAISATAMERRAARTYDQESLDLARDGVQANPDFATLWNFRREVLRHMHPEPAADAEAAAIEAFAAARRPACEAELALTQECLGLNPKSYPVWSHRQWVMEWGRCAWQHERELKLTSKFLALDDRNFHCWTYRRFLVRAAGVPAEAELSFTTTKIESNFSNYSAWHQRSKLLPVLAAAKGGPAGGAAALGTAVRDELQLVRNAFYTAPEDSSAWFYHRWLLAQLAPEGGAAAAPPAEYPESTRKEPAEYEALLRDELAMTEELLELEPDAKWPLATAAFLGTLLARGGGGEADAARTAERLAVLQKVDGARANFYAHAAAQARGAA